MQFHDISRWQGDYNMNDGNEIIVIKMSGGDDGLYLDSKANRNYYAAKNAGKAVGMYHFAGATDPVGEAHFFIRAVSPLEQNDVLILDWEVHHPNPVEWCRVFIQTVKDETGVIPMIYMNTSTENNYDWSPVIQQNVGLWVADYRFQPADNVPIRHWPTYIAHQYTSSPLDTSEWFGSKEQFQKYGYQVPQPETPPTPSPAPEPAPQPEPVPQPDPTPPAPEPTPAPETPITNPVPPVTVTVTPPVITTTVTVSKPAKQNWLVKLINAILRFFDIKVK